jgi:hypothetical protein
MCLGNNELHPMLKRVRMLLLPEDCGGYNCSCVVEVFKQFVWVNAGTKRSLIVEPLSSVKAGRAVLAPISPNTTGKLYM